MVIDRDILEVTLDLERKHGGQLDPEQWLVDNNVDFEAIKMFVDTTIDSIADKEKNKQNPYSTMFDAIGNAFMIGWEVGKAQSK